MYDTDFRVKFSACNDRSNATKKTMLTYVKTSLAASQIKDMSYFTYFCIHMAARTYANEDGQIFKLVLEFDYFM